MAFMEPDNDFPFFCAGNISKGVHAILKNTSFHIRLRLVCRLVYVYLDPKVTKLRPIT